MKHWITGILLTVWVSLPTYLKSADVQLPPARPRVEKPVEQKPAPRPEAKGDDAKQGDMSFVPRQSNAPRPILKSEQISKAEIDRSRLIQADAIAKGQDRLRKQAENRSAVDNKSPIGGDNLKQSGAGRTEVRDTGNLRSTGPDSFNRGAGGSGDIRSQRTAVDDKRGDKSAFTLSDARTRPGGGAAGIDRNLNGAEGLKGNGTEAKVARAGGIGDGFSGVEKSGSGTSMTSGETGKGRGSPQIGKADRADFTLADARTRGTTNQSLDSKERQSQAVQDAKGRDEVQNKDKAGAADASRLKGDGEKKKASEAQDNEKARIAEDARSKEAAVKDASERKAASESKGANDSRIRAEREDNAAEQARLTTDRLASEKLRNASALRFEERMAPGLDGDSPRADDVRATKGQESIRKPSPDANIVEDENSRPPAQAAVSSKGEIRKRGSANSFTAEGQTNASVGFTLEGASRARLSEGSNNERVEQRQDRSGDSDRAQELHEGHGHSLFAAKEATNAGQGKSETSNTTTEKDTSTAKGGEYEGKSFDQAQGKGGWILPKEGGGATINGRWYTEHALERMAPNTQENMATLEARALRRAEEKGLKPGTSKFKEWYLTNGPSPRGIPPSVVEAELAKPGTTGVQVITNEQGDVVTVMKGKK